MMIKIRINEMLPVKTMDSTHVTNIITEPKYMRTANRRADTMIRFSQLRMQ